MNLLSVEGLSKDYGERALFENLSLSKSLPSTRTKKLIGVTIIKKTKAIIIGPITLPKISPNFIQE